MIMVKELSRYRVIPKTVCKSNACRFDKGLSCNASGTRSNLWTKPSRELMDFPIVRRVVAADKNKSELVCEMYISMNGMTIKLCAWKVNSIPLV